MDAIVEAGWWAPASLWAAVYASDFALSIWGARLYRRLDGRFFRFESYELTPFFRTTVDRGSWWSPRFVAMLAISTAMVAFVAWGWRGEPRGQSILLGLLLLTEAAVHVRHVRNIALFRALLRATDVEGLISYPLWLGYWNSVAECVAFACLYAVVAAVDGSLFCLGGTIGMLLLAGSQQRLLEAARRTTESRSAGKGARPG